MQVYKNPEFEDDSYYFVIEKTDDLSPVNGEYFNLKKKAFRDQDVSKRPFKKFFDLPSFTGVENQLSLVGTIYTVAAEFKNAMEYKDMLRAVKRNKDKSRRCVIVIADTLRAYLDDRVNTSCLNIIHYHKDSVKLFFRASDITNELLYDLHLIKEFFIDPIYKEQPEIHVISSTAQNIKPFKTLIV